MAIDPFDVSHLIGGVSPEGPEPFDVSNLIPATPVASTASGSRYPVLPGLMTSSMIELGAVPARAPQQAATATAGPMPEQTLGTLGKIGAGAAVESTGRALSGTGEGLGYSGTQLQKRLHDETAGEGAQGVLSTGRRMGELTARIGEWFKGAGKTTKEFGEEHFQVDPRLKETLLGKTAGIVGGAVPMVVAMALSGGAVLPGAMIAGAGAYDSTLEQARKAGATEEQAHNAAAISALGNAGLMSIPLGQWFKLPAAVQQGLMKTFAETAKHAGTMAAISQLQRGFDNALAQKTYDPERGLNEGFTWTDLGAQGIAGAVIPGTIAGTRRAGAALEPVANRVARAITEPRQQPHADEPWLDPQGMEPRAWDVSRNVARETSGAPAGPAELEAPQRLLPGPKAQEIELAAQEVNTEPTDGQKSAGNYKKGHFEWNGLDLAIENPRGSVRSNKDPNGEPWSVVMPDHYGYIKSGPNGADGQKVDMYMGPNPDSPRVFGVDQVHAGTGKFDEHKVMLGYDDPQQAMAAYHRAFSDGRGPERVGAVTEMTVPEFKQFLGWLADGNAKKPLQPQAVEPLQQQRRQQALAAGDQDPAAAAGRLPTDLPRASDVAHLPTYEGMKAGLSPGLLREKGRYVDDAVRSIQDLLDLQDDLTVPSRRYGLTPEDIRETEGFIKDIKEDLANWRVSPQDFAHIKQYLEKNKGRRQPNLVDNANENDRRTAQQTGRDAYNRSRRLQGLPRAIGALQARLQEIGRQLDEPVIAPPPVDKAAQALGQHIAQAPNIGDAVGRAAPILNSMRDRVGLVVMQDGVPKDPATFARVLMEMHKAVGMLTKDVGREYQISPTDPGYLTPEERLIGSAFNKFFGAPNRPTMMTLGAYLGHPELRWFEDGYSGEVGLAVPNDVKATDLATMLWHRFTGQPWSDRPRLLGTAAEPHPLDPSRRVQVTPEAVPLLLEAAQIKRQLPELWAERQALAKANERGDLMAALGGDRPLPTSPVEFPRERIESHLETVRSMQHVTPPDTAVKVVTRIIPLAPKAGQPQKALLHFEDANGKTSTLIIPLSFAMGSTAFVSRDGSLIGLLPLSEGAGPAVSGHLWHEILHVLRGRSILDDATFDRLVAHAHQLRILDQPLNTILALVGANPIPGIGNQTLGDTYRNLYTKPGHEPPPNIQELLNQEAVNFMFQLWHHGHEIDVGPILKDLQDITAGKFNGRGGTQRGAAAPADPRTLFMLAGEKAKTVDREALAKAKEMEAAGAPREDIWQQTGMWKARDGKWRWEISDDKAEYSPGRLDARVRENTGHTLEEIRRRGVSAPLREVLDHPDFYAAYPQLADTPWTAVPPEKMGLRGAGGTWGGVREGMALDNRISPRLEQGKSVTLHEGEHGIQDAEDFARGGNQAQFQGMRSSGQDLVLYEQLSRLDDAKMVQRVAKEQGLSIDDAAAWIEDKYERAPSADAIKLARETPERLARAEHNIRLSLDDMQDPRHGYMRLHGEAEARLVQKRMNMTPEERRARPPWLDLDVPEENLLISRVGAQPTSAENYRGEHGAPDAESGAPIHDVSANGIYPSDFYGPNGLRYYGTGDDAADLNAYNKIRALKGKPDEKVKVWRAVPFVEGKPKGLTLGSYAINPGDWVAINRQYAVDHGESALNGKYHIAQRIVPASELFTSGDSLHEWGWSPKSENGPDFLASMGGHEAPPEEPAQPGPVDKKRPGPDNPGRGITRDNRHGFVPGYRVRVPPGIKNLPDKSMFTQETNNKNAERQVANLDIMADQFPDPGASLEDWTRMMAMALADRDVPMPPYNFVRQMADGGAGAVELLSTLTPGQIEQADHGFRAGAKFQERYRNGQMTPEVTAKLLGWGFLSRGVSPYVQEGLFLDSFHGLNPWISKAAQGDFTEKDLPAFYAWSETAAPAGSGQPGSGASHNLNAFGRNFLIAMAKPLDAGDPWSISRLQHMHNLMADQTKTGPQIRREFLKFGEGVGIDNKVVSFALLVSGRPDVMVLDRVQMAALWDDGRFKDINLYDGEKEGKKAKTGTAFSNLTYGARGLMIYEAIERSLAQRLAGIYEQLGRPQDASIGRYHWESWVANSQQEASHGTLEALLNEAERRNNPRADITTRQGEYGSYAYGSEYGYDAEGNRFFLYTTPNGTTYRMSPERYREFIEELKKPRNKIVPRNFKVTESANEPWFRRPEVDQERLDALAAGFGRAEQRSVAPVPDAARGTDGPGSGAGPEPEFLAALGGHEEPARQRQVDELGFYSHALEAAHELSQAKGTPQQMLAMLKKAGVKDAEIKATELDKFLEGKKSVTRDEILKHLEENRVGLKATTYGGEGNNGHEELIQEAIDSWRESEINYLSRYESFGFDYPDIHTKHERSVLDFAREKGAKLDEDDFYDHPIDALREAGFKVDSGAVPLWGEHETYLFVTAPDGTTLWKSTQAGHHVYKSYDEAVTDLELGAREAAVEAVDVNEDRKREELREELQDEVEDDTQWSRYSLDRGKPTNVEGKPTNYTETVLHLAGMGDLYDKAAQRRGYSGWTDHIPEEVRDKIKIGHALPVGFIDSHWDGIPDVLGHLRTSEQTTTDGKRVLNADEIQMEWSKKIRDARRNAYALKLYGKKRFGELTDEEKAGVSKQIDADAPNWIGGTKDEAKIAELKKRVESASIQREHAISEAREFILQNGFPERGANDYLVILPALEALGADKKSGVLSVFPESKEKQATRERARQLRTQLTNAEKDRSLAQAEVRNAESAAPGHPIVNTSDQALHIPLMKLIQMAVERGVDGITIPNGDTIIGYGMGGKPAGQRYAYDKMYPNALGKALRGMDKSPAMHRSAVQLKGHERKGDFTYYPVTEAVKQEVKSGLKQFRYGGKVS